MFYYVCDFSFFQHKVFTHLRPIREDGYYDDDKHDDMLKTVRLFNKYLYTAFVR